MTCLHKFYDRARAIHRHDEPAAIEFGRELLLSVALSINGTAHRV